MNPRRHQSSLQKRGGRDELTPLGRSERTAVVVETQVVNTHSQRTWFEDPIFVWSCWVTDPLSESSCPSALGMLVALSGAFSQGGFSEVLEQERRRPLRPLHEMQT